MLIRHKEEIEALRSVCKHKKISDWTDYMWAPSHYGLPVKVCKSCGEIVKRKKMKQFFHKVHTTK